MAIIDGLVTRNVVHATNTDSLTLTTTAPNELIIVMWGSGSYPNTTGGSSILSSISDTAGLTWTIVPPAEYGGNYFQACGLAWASSPSALTGDVITLTYNQNFDCECCAAFGVYTTNPTPDGNASLPAAQSGASTFPDVVFSTTHNRTIAFGIVGGVGSSVGTPPSGWTQIFSVYNNSGIGSEDLLGAYIIYSSAQTNQHFQTGANDINYGVSAFVDAFRYTAGGSAAPPKSGLSLMGCG